MYKVCGAHKIEVSRAQFDLTQTFECGQCFRWKKIENTASDGVGYAGIVGDKYLELYETENAIIFNASEADFLSVWKHYFDLDTDYSEIHKALIEEDPVMREAIDYGRGIRLLRQDPWEMLITFILSSNNNIPRIKGSIEKLSQWFGEPIEMASMEAANCEADLSVLKAFPTPERLAGVSKETFREAGAGYRDQFLHAVAQLVASGVYDLKALTELQEEALQKRLMALPGVGEKVAACVMLFGFHRMSSFPVDTWVKRVMRQVYFDHEASAGEISAFALATFGSYAGYAQQFLFNWIRAKGLEGISK